jgi:hypothetical protein
VEDYSRFLLNSSGGLMTADDLLACNIVGGHKLRLRATALALRGPPLLFKTPH